MNYTFRVGDMLQTKEGVRGQIMSNPIFDGDTIVISSYDKIILRYQLKDIDGIFEFSGNCKTLPLIFDQIGRYDFTKKSEIESLEYGKVMQKEGSLTTISMDKVIDKINEIIDYLKYQ